MFTLKNLTILLFVCINLCCALSINAQCNNSNKKVGALIAYGTDDGQKTPLILIHGIHGTDPSPNRTEPGHKRTEANQYWNEFKAKYVADKDLTSKYVIYDFQYYSNQESVQDIACELGLFIDEKIPDRKHVILAHSMGGLVAKAYMVFYSHKSGEWSGMKGGETVIGAITLATPHHGTHGSNDVNALKQHIGFGWKQVIDKLNFAYWSDRAGFFSPQSLASGMPNRGDLRWDNYDKAISANSLTNNDVNIWLPTANKKFEQFAPKVILYAGEMRLDNIANSPQSALKIALNTPIYDDHQRLSFANDLLINGFANKFGSTDGLVPYKSSLLCDSPPYRISRTTSNFICDSKYKVRRFEAGKWDATPNERPDANTLSIKRIPRGYDHKDMYEHPDVLLYVMSDLRGFLKNSKTPEVGTVRKNSIGMEFVYIPSGEFLMGSTDFIWETPIHKVEIKKGFWMGIYEVTQAQWQKVMDDNPSFWKECGNNCPVEQVSWEDTKRYLQKLNQLNDGFEYRLPTESEWEYAARAGTTTTYGGSGILSEMGWTGEDELVVGTRQVGLKKPNAWGLYDMHGNVSEWCEDIFAQPYNEQHPVDGSANTKGDGFIQRVERGGSYTLNFNAARSAHRMHQSPAASGNDIGFRVVARLK